MIIPGKLIVSCQADEGEAFYGFMDRYALAAVAGGAAGIRANGPRDIQAIRKAVSVPIIGIQKSLHSDGKVLITPSYESAKALVEAGATMVALDCTRRGQQSGAFERLARIRSELQVPVLADIATIEEAVQAVKAGADMVLSTMRGYTEDTSHVTAFDAAFIQQLVHAVSVPVIAEGRVDTPDLARKAIRAGAFCVIVGTAITRPHTVTRLFAAAVEDEYALRKTGQTILGIDMGGTNTKFGLISDAGVPLWEDTVPTPAQSGREGLLTHLERIAVQGLQRSRDMGFDPAAVGIATAGWVNPSTGAVAYATETLPGWTGAPIAQRVSAATGLRVSVENDANALAVGEKEFGAGREFTDFVCITLGTGVGGGCYIGGRLNRGAHFFANALGHICIEPNGRPCTCGQAGCLEMYTNAAALLGFADHRYPSAEGLIAAANAGESSAVSAVAAVGRHLARGCSVLLQLLDPQALILAGGLVQNNPLLISILELELRTRVPVWEQRRMTIRESGLGYHAGVLGAAAVARTG